MIELNNSKLPVFTYIETLVESVFEDLPGDKRYEDSLYPLFVPAPSAFGVAVTWCMVLLSPEALDAKKVTLVVLLDLSKAFDSIDHVTLLATLQALGVSRASLDWFKSYLSERLRCVRVEAETSSLQGISHGQGLS